MLNKSDLFWTPPLIYSGYFTNSSDLDVLVEEMETTLKLFDAESFKKNDFKLMDKLSPYLLVNNLLLGIVGNA